MDADNVSPSVSRTRKRQSLATGSGQAPEAYDEDASNKEKDIKRLQCLINTKNTCMFVMVIAVIDIDAGDSYDHDDGLPCTYMMYFCYHSDSL